MINQLEGPKLFVAMGLPTEAYLNHVSNLDNGIILCWIIEVKVFCSNKNLFSIVGSVRMNLEWMSLRSSDVHITDKRMQDFRQGFQ